MMDQALALPAPSDGLLVSAANIAERCRAAASEDLKKAWGQYFTSPAIAAFMSSLIEPQASRIRESLARVGRIVLAGASQESTGEMRHLRKFSSKIHNVGQLLSLLGDLPPSTPVAISTLPAHSEDGEQHPLDLSWASMRLLQESILVLTPAVLRAEDRLLFEAIERRDTDMCRVALERGADVNARDARSLLFDGDTPLHAVSDSPSLLALLLTYGAEVNARSTSGWTPLMRACNFGNTQSATLLLAAGADPTATNDEGYTALDRVSSDNPSLLQLMRNAQRT